ncbi:hypothetical protein [Paenibacillus apiarius]|uniref:hypothetical protein n=1 Tax=Paenibacillus apiarius TaxID=46240 RepID=UPI003B3BCC44
MREPVVLEGDYGPIIISFGNEDPHKVMEDLHAACAAALLDAHKEKQDKERAKAAV